MEPSTLPSASSSSTRMPTCGTPTSGSALPRLAVQGAVDKGLLDPGRSLLAGMRGSLYGPEDAGMPEELGFDVIPCEELVALSAEEYGSRARERVGEGPLFLSFDIDVLDPA